jgi:hypothetical protein
MSRTTITKAVDELNNGDSIDGKTRRSGGGRKFVEPHYPDIEKRNRKIIEGKTYGGSYAGTVVHNRKFKKNTNGFGA